MTTEQRFERQLPALLEDLYLGPTPDYRDEVLTVATHRRQRPAWAFPGRWIPMADIASRSAFVPRAPWRTIGVALVLITLLVATLVYVGSRQTRVPPPFGVARNGLIAYAADGDILTADPTTGLARVIVGGDTLDRAPVFSRDGTRIAFLRQVPGAYGQFHLAVVGRDGGSVTIVTANPIEEPALLDWSPDSGALIVGVDTRLLRYALNGTSDPVEIATGIHVMPGAFRPPDGAQILYQLDDSGDGLWVMNADGTGGHAVYRRAAGVEGGNVSGSIAWSPDGRFIAFGLNGPNDTYARIHVINADGTGFTRLDHEPGTWVDNDLVWSPDSAWIAFNRWRENQVTLNWEIQPIGIVSVAGGAVKSLGPTPHPDGALFGYSPDGTTIISLPGSIYKDPTWSIDASRSVGSPDLIDVASGNSRRLDLALSSAASWQRLAPEP